MEVNSNFCLISLMHHCSYIHFDLVWANAHKSIFYLFTQNVATQDCVSLHPRSSYYSIYHTLLSHWIILFNPCHLCWSHLTYEHTYHSSVINLECLVLQIFAVFLNINYIYVFMLHLFFWTLLKHKVQYKSVKLPQIYTVGQTQSDS